ncbi:hypothetical protein BUZ59_11020 [Staphylococcus kloosii]|nr:hypothetical protein [Staphylococcus kloosii]MCD8879172.1 hypothetical protein [Staphylococcus kloosii]PTJ74944.1 hypothetical protein BUZ59_11020 [Staphylococcus kloosii]
MMSQEVLSIYAAMKIYPANNVPGVLTLFGDKVHFEANGALKGTEIRNDFYFSEINNMKMSLSMQPYKISIKDSENELWEFNQVAKKEGQKFVELYNDINGQ